MSGIDPTALEAAYAAAERFIKLSAWYKRGIVAAIEAYESAKPSPWRPIEGYDRDHDTGNWVLVHRDQRMAGSFDLMFWDDSFEWCVAAGERTYTHDDLVNRGAQFRTIDPPSGVDATRAAEDAS